MAVKKHLSSKHKSRKQKTHNSTAKNMIGGNLGANVFPPAYFGGNKHGYFEAGSPELKSCGSQIAVSEGIIHPDGKYAGPNLFPMAGGSKKRHHRHKQSKKHNNKSKKNNNKSKRNNKSKSKSKSKRNNNKTKKNNRKH